MLLKRERHDFVMKHINLHHKLLTNDLVQLLNVSEDTIRRDLRELSDHNLLYKIHGGALSRSYYTAYHDKIIIEEAKIDIAKKTVPIIKEGMVILIGGGDIAIELIKQLPEAIGATFFTISPLVAVELTRFENLEVILIGGAFSKNAKVTYGKPVMNQVSQIKADLCLVEIDGIHYKNGLSDADSEIAMLKRTMLNAAQKSAVLCYSNILDKPSETRISSLQSIDYLITDLNPSDHKLENYHTLSLQLV